MLEKEEYLAKGKRSVVYKGFFKGKEAVLKVANDELKLNIGIIPDILLCR